MIGTFTVTIEGNPNYESVTLTIDLIYAEPGPAKDLVQVDKDFTSWTYGEYSDNNKPTIGVEPATDSWLEEDDIEDALTYTYAKRGSDVFLSDVPTAVGEYTVKVDGYYLVDAPFICTKVFEITPCRVNIEGITAVDREYKYGYRTVTLKADNPTVGYDGTSTIVQNDIDNRLIYVDPNSKLSGLIEDEDYQATTQKVQISGVMLAGDAAGNYIYDQPTTEVDIDKATLGKQVYTKYVKNNTAETYTYNFAELLSPATHGAHFEYTSPDYQDGDDSKYDFVGDWLNEFKWDDNTDTTAIIKLNAVQAKPGDKIGTVTVEAHDSANYEPVLLERNLLVEGGNGGTTPTPNPNPNPGGNNGGGNGGSSKHGNSGNSRSFWIFVADSVHGEIVSSHEYARSETQITLNAAPEEEFSLNWLSILTRGGDEVEFHDMGDGRYIFTMPASSVFVYSSFMDPVDFQDVPADAYYRDAVTWAAANRIFSSTSKNTFSLNDECTRAQIVTFLWRTAGCPEPTAAAGFADVAEDAYYARAVAWAVENGITGGTGNGLFSPDAPCTRAQAMAFLYRTMGQPETDGSAEFGDVPADAYYAKAVAWAAARGITSGVGEELFGSDLSCTRAQIASFLYRAH